MSRNSLLEAGAKSEGEVNMIALTQIINTEIFAFIAVLVFTLLRRKVLSFQQ